MHTRRTAFLFCALALPLAAARPDDAGVKAIIDKVISEKPETRLEARGEAAAAGAPAVLPLARLMTSVPDSVKDAAVRLEASRTARFALDGIVHRAGRPGADAERKAVAAEIAKLLEPGESPQVKREALYWSGCIGDDAIVPRVARLVDDPDRNVSETARLALERIPGKAAVDALVEAARAREDDRKADYLFSIGKKGDASASGFLAETATKSRGKARVAAFEALARLAGPEAGAAFEKALTDRDAPDRIAIFTEYLRYAANLADKGMSAAAMAIYRKALAEAPADHQRERALFQLAPEGSAEGLQAVVTGLGDSSERVRELALSRAKSLTGPDVTSTLRKAYTEGRAEARPAVLRAIVEKDKAAGASLLAEAVESSQPELRITALDLSGKLDDPANEDLFWKAAKEGSAQIRPVALRGYLLVAKKRLAAGEKDHAGLMYSRALEAAQADEDRGEALRGLIEVGDVKSIDTLGGLLKDPVLGNDAAKGYVSFAGKLADKGEKEAAEKRLLEIVSGDFQRAAKTQAMEELRRLGRDPQKIVRGNGFVIDWHLLTPIQDPDGKALEKEFFPEKVIELEKESRIGERKFRWQKYGDVTLDGVVDLLGSFRRSEKVITYAYTEIDWPKEEEVLFKMGSDDGIACFLNGQRIHLNNASRSLKVDEDTVKAKLQAGKNRVLLKISNAGGTWAFAFRVTDLNGKALPQS